MKNYKTLGKKSKKTHIDGKIYHVHGLEKLILLNNHITQGSPYQNTSAIFHRNRTNSFKIFQFSSVTQSSLTLCDLMDCSSQASLSITNSWSLLKFMSIEAVMPSNHLILCFSLLIPPSIFPSIRVFSNESVLHIRWPKCWSFSFSISPSNEHSGLISFRMDRLDLLAV